MIDDATLFAAMQSIECAREKPTYEPGRLIEIDSRAPSEMAYVASDIFGNAIKELKKRGILSIHNFPDDKSEFHFRVFPNERKFQALYRELEKKNPQVVDPRAAGPRTLRYKSLSFNVYDGTFAYGNVRGKLRPYSEMWSALFSLMNEKEKSVMRSKIQAQIISSWKASDNKKKHKLQNRIDVEDIIKRLRRKLRMGGVKGAVNSDLIHGDGNNTAYILKAKHTM